MTLLEQYRDAFLVIHIIAGSIAVGVATVHDISFNQQINIFHAEKWNYRLFRLYRGLILNAIFWLLVSGIALFWPLREELLDSPVFVLKLFISGFVSLVSFLLYQFVMPKVPESLKYSNKRVISGHAARRLAFGLSAVALTSWYSVVALSIVRNINIGLTTLGGFYLALLVISFILGLIAEYRFSQRFKRQSRETIKVLADSLLKDISGRIAAFSKE